MQSVTQKPGLPGPAAPPSDLNRRSRLCLRLLPITLFLLLLSACAPGEAPPPAVCDTYNRALFTTQLIGGAAVLLGLAVVGLRKNLTAILPSEGVNLASAAASTIIGLILLAFSTAFGNQLLTGFGIESLYVACGLG
jgi:hypothetical protein